MTETPAPSDRPTAVAWREAVLAGLGIAPGSRAALDVGAPTAEDESPEDTVERACRAATHPEAYPSLPPHHPASRRTGAVDLVSVRTDVLQIGVRIEAPDRFTLGIVTARLITALAAEGIGAVPGSDAAAAPSPWQTTPSFAVGLVVFV